MLWDLVRPLLFGSRRTRLLPVLSVRSGQGDHVPVLAFNAVVRDRFQVEVLHLEAMGALGPHRCPAAVPPLRPLSVALTPAGRWEHSGFLSRPPYGRCRRMNAPSRGEYRQACRNCNLFHGDIAVTLTNLDSIVSSVHFSQRSSKSAVGSETVKWLKSVKTLNWASMLIQYSIVPPTDHLAGCSLPAASCPAASQE